MTRAFTLIAGAPVKNRTEGGHTGDDLVHIEGEPLSGMSTLCGYVDVRVQWRPAEGPITCRSCWNIYQGVRAMPKYRGPS